MTRAVEPELVRVPHALIDEPALPSRSELPDDHLATLAADMRVHGFTSTIILARVGDRYEVIAGHCRWHAARAANIALIPALVYPTKHDGIEAMQWTENALRADLPPADEAVWFAELVERHPTLGTDGVAARLGLSRGYLEGRLALLRGDTEVFAALKARTITIGVAQQLNRISHQTWRRYYLDLAVTHGATIGIVQRWVHDLERTLLPATQDGAAFDAPAPPPPTSITDYWRCVCCEREHDTAQMIPIQIHRYCIQAQLTPALELYRDRHLLVRRPRTIDEAAALVSEVLDQFPALAGESDGSTLAGSAINPEGRGR